MKRVFRLVGWWIRRRSREDELNEELEFHLSAEAEDRVAAGETEDEARQKTRREFGNVTRFREACRDARGTAAIDASLRDAAYAVRRLARDWPFTAAAVLILGLGIGATTAIFSVVHAMLLRPSAVADPERLVDIYQNARDGSVGMNSFPAYEDMAAYTDVLAEAMAVSVPAPTGYRDRDEVRTALVEYATPNYLSVLGLSASLGRWFTPDEDVPGAALVAVVGHRSWMTRFGGDPSILGRTLRIEGFPVTIVGVGPVGHNATLDIGLITDFWMPAAAIPALFGAPGALGRRPVESMFFVKARLGESVTLAEAQAAMDSLGARLAREYPDEDPGRGITVIPTSDVRVHPQMDVLLKGLASALLTVVGLVLALACSNLATLLLVRGTARAKEISVRLALGASRWQLVRQLLTESVLLASAGGVAGCVMAWWGIGAIRLIELPIVVDFGIDRSVLAFATALSIITGIAFGLAPALATTRPSLLPTLQGDGAPPQPEHRWLTLKHALVVFQVTVSIVLLAAAGVFLELRSAAEAQQLGFAVDGVAILKTDARFAGYSPDDAARLYEELGRRVAAIPGVQSVALLAREPMVVDGLPLVLDGVGRADGDTLLVAGAIWAGPGYFETLQIPILAGRALDERDRPDAPRAAVISESMARQHFGGLGAVGRRFRIDQDPNWIEVVGVAGDTKTADLGDIVDPIPYLFYRASAQWSQPSGTVVARTSLDAGALVASIERELGALDPALPVVTAKTMASHLNDSLAAVGAVVSALGAVGVLGLILAGIGVHAVVAFAVSRRTREIGIRMALGARGGQVARRVVGGVAVLLGVGAACGLAVSGAVILALRGLTAPSIGFAYSPGIEPIALAAIVAFLAVVGLLAAWAPARRAARMDPLGALRHD